MTWTPIAVIVVVLATAAVIRIIEDSRARPDVSAVGLPVLVRNTLYLRDGHHVFLDGDDGPTQATVVPSGYVYNTHMRLAGGPIYLRRTNLLGVGGEYATLGELADPRYAVSSDGRFVVAIMRSPHRLPQLTTDHTTEAVVTDLTTDRSMTDANLRQPVLLNVAGDWALLRDDLGGAADLWNLRTGKIQHLLPAAFPYEAVRPDGQVIRGRDVPGAAEAAPAPSFPDGSVRPPPPEARKDGAAIVNMLPSPQGDWALADTPSQSYLVQVTDLEAGSWVAVPLGATGGASTAFWDSPTSVIRPSGNGYERCTVSGRCRQLPLPAHAVAVQVLGA